MSAQLALRDYQSEALAELDAGWATGLQRLAVVLPTGGGKTVVFAHLIHRALAEGHRPIVLVHREELAEQAADKIRTVAGDVTVGIVKAGRNETDADVIVASVQTLARPARLKALLAEHGAPGIVVVDECHHAVARTWVEVLTGLGGFDGTSRVAGFTATMSREDGRGLGDVWQKVVTRRDILDFIQHDPPYLVDVRGRAVTVDGFDLATIARSRGDYQEGQLGEALEASGAGEVIAQKYLEEAAERPGVIFAPTVATAESFAEDMNAAGIVTAVITGATSTEDRRLIYKRYRAGDIQVLSNCMVLTEGWDAPWCSCAVIARPTSSAALYTQMVGRVLRPFPGKRDALVLDVVGVAGRHALRTLVDLTSTDVTIAEGESLAEAIEREAAEREHRPADRTRAAGVIAAADVDLFQRSASVWLQTLDGKWFIPTKHWTYFIWPEANSVTWKVGRLGTWRLWKDSPQAAREGSGWVREGLEMGYAMALGEAEANDADPSISRRTASWRRPSNKVTEAQLGQMARLKVSAPDHELNRAEASDLISIYQATRDLAKFKIEP